MKLPSQNSVVKMSTGLRRDENCNLCKLSKTAEFICLLGQGPTPSEIMAIGEAPGQREDDSGKPFVGRSGQFLIDSLKRVGLDRTNVFITNAVACRPPQNRTPTKAEIKVCSQWLQYQIAMVKPKFVLLLGNTPLMSITGKGGIRAARGKPFVRDGVTYVPTYHPAYILRDPRAESSFIADLEFFKLIVDTGKIPEEEGLNFHIVNDRDTLWRMYEDLRHNYAISYDIETSGLYPWHNPDGSASKVISLGFGTAKHQWCIPIGHPGSKWTKAQVKDMIEELDLILTDRQLIAHNGKFDALWMWVHYGVQWFCDFDTMLAHYLINENDLHDLKGLARVFLGAPNWDIDKTEKQGIDVPLERHCRYLAHDVFYTRKLRYKFGRMLDREPEVKQVFTHILMPCHRLFTEVEYDGAFVNLDHMEKAEHKLRSDLRRARVALKKWGNINWGSTKQLANLLYGELGITCPQKTKTGNPSTSESTLNQIDHPCIADLLKFRAAKQQLAFFIEGWKPYLVGSFLHPSFKLHGTVTGRPSCEHPNFQQVPRDPIIRALIDAPPGWVLLEADLSQIELRIAAELAQERAMLTAFLNGVDVHWLTAIREIARGGGQRELVLDTARTWKQDKSIEYAEAIEVLLEMGPDQAVEISIEWKELRKKAKAINFGYLYGMWWKKFKIYARDNYGVSVTDDEAMASREFFFDNYPDFVSWHRRQKGNARRNGYVSSLTGRRRRLPEAMSFQDSPERGAAERQAVNAPVQSLASDWNLMSALQIRHEFSRSVVRICATVHDAILMWVKPDRLKEVHDRVLEIMRHPAIIDDLGIKLRVPIEAEAKVGPWGNGISLRKWQDAHKSV